MTSSLPFPIKHDTAASSLNKATGRDYYYYYNLLFTFLDSTLDSHVCSICSKAFPKRCTLLYHMKICHTKQLSAFQCNVCPSCSFTRLNALLHHQNHAHPENTACRRCGQSYDTHKSLLDHTCIEKLPYVCEGCAAGFSELRYLISHSRKCDDYSCYTPKLREYHYHFKGSKRYCCYTCGLKFTRLGDLGHHRMKEHFQSTDLLTYDLGSKSGQEVKGDEQNVHSREPESIICCQFCGISFNDEKCLRHHLSSKHPFQSKEDYSCNICSINCFSEKHLQHHKQVVHSFGVETVQTPGGFTQPSNLNCPYCGLIFMTPFSLSRHIEQRHMLSQSNNYCITELDSPINSPVASICVEIDQPRDYISIPSEPAVINSAVSISQPSAVESKSKISKRTIKELTVNESAAYQCQTCNKICSTHISLMHHIRRIHPSLAAHKCDLCLKVYMRRDCLLRHKKNSHFNPSDIKSLPSSHDEQEYLALKPAPKPMSKPTSKQKSMAHTTKVKSKAVIYKQKSKLKYNSKLISNWQNSQPTTHEPTPKQEENTLETYEKLLAISETQCMHKCSLCFSSFQTLLLLLDHKQKAHPSQSNDDISFKHQPKLKGQHISKGAHKSKKQIFKCLNCRRWFSNAKSLRVHQKKEHKKALFKDKVKHSHLNSAKNRINEEDGASHRRLDDNVGLAVQSGIKDPGKDSFECLICGRVYLLHGSLLRHHKKAHGIDSSPSYIHTPAAKTSEKEMFPCPDCHRKYIHKCSLTKHHKKVHS